MKEATKQPQIAIGDPTKFLSLINLKQRKSYFQSQITSKAANLPLMRQNYQYSSQSW